MCNSILAILNVFVESLELCNGLKGNVAEGANVVERRPMNIDGSTMLHRAVFIFEILQNVSHKIRESQAASAESKFQVLHFW